ncbi:MAG: beta/gamma crystallin-related protein [Xanthobacteraceae bacterium]
MSRTLILTLAAAATIAVASFASSASYARGGGGGHGGGGGGHVSGGGHVGGGGRAGGGGHVRVGGRGGRDGGRVARNGDRPGHPERFGRPEHPGRLADHHRGHWILRDGRWIDADPVDGDLPDVAPVSDASPDSTSQQAQGGQCAVSVYWDADFKGERWDTEQNQRYVGNHWNDQISSIRVISGTWRFYWDADYGGEMVELKPGEYHYVGGHWNDQISSFRCVATDATTSR